MGVEWFIFCDKHYEKVHLGNIHGVKQYEKFFKQTFEKEFPDWIADIAPGPIVGVLNEIQKFKNRHKGCEIGYYSDHMDVEDYLDYYLEVDYLKSLPTKDDFLKNVAKKAPFVVVSHRHAKPDWGKTHRYELYLSNIVPNILWDDPDRHKAEVQIGIRHVLGNWTKATDEFAQLQGMPKEIHQTVYETVDGRLFRTFFGGSGDFITKNEYEKIKEKYGKVEE